MALPGAVPFWSAVRRNSGAWWRGSEAPSACVRVGGLCVVAAARRYVVVVLRRFFVLLGGLFVREARLLLDSGEVPMNLALQRHRHYSAEFARIRLKSPADSHPSADFIAVVDHFGRGVLWSRPKKTTRFVHCVFDSSRGLLWYPPKT
jgi:hypothetical protein